MIDINFYNYFISLCNKKGVKPSRAALDIGLSKTAVHSWKIGKSLPTDANLDLIATYFDIPIIDFHKCDDIRQRDLKSRIARLQVELYEAEHGIYSSDEQKSPATESDGGKDNFVLTDREKRLLELFRSQPEEKLQAVLSLLDISQDDL